VQPLPTPRPTVVVASPAAPDRPTVLAPVAVRPVALPATPARPASDFSRPYLVAPGETLYALARRVGVRPTELAAWNNISPTTPLRAGQMLHLSPSGTEVAQGTSYTNTTPGMYTVASGDTFYSISRRYNCTVAELLAHNERPALTLRVGETLRVPRQ
jgi:LysM repeat protein